MKLLFTEMRTMMRGRVLGRHPSKIKRKFGFEHAKFGFPVHQASRVKTFEYEWGGGAHSDPVS